jgi:hypothetical protein
VKFSFSSEQEEFRSNLRRLLADLSPTKEVRRLQALWAVNTVIAQERLLL